MNSHFCSRRPIAFLALTIVAMLLVPSRAGAQSRPKKEFAGGTDCLRWLLKNAGLEPNDDAGKIAAEPRRSILIVLGDLGWLENGIPQGVVSYVERGGALLVASDKGSGRSVPNLAGVQIPGAHIESKEVPDDCHANQYYRPFVIPEPLPAEEIDNPFDGFKVATNIPSFLDWRGSLPGGVYCLARFPPRVRVTSTEGRSHTYGRPADGFATLLQSVASGMRGRFLVLADHSVFINEMMLPDTCSNFAFTVRSLEWLNGSGEQRS